VLHVGVATRLQSTIRGSSQADCRPAARAFVLRPEPWSPARRGDSSRRAPGSGCYQAGVIVSMHAATGATVGAAVGSPVVAALLGVPLHLAGDRVPHRDIRNRRFELVSGIGLVALLALRRGVTDSATVGALAASIPDLEHLVRLPRPGGSKLFHGRRGWHRSGHLSTRTQLLVAGVLTGRLLAAATATIRWQGGPLPCLGGGRQADSNRVVKAIAARPAGGAPISVLS
jgi:hypothetical protein